MTNALIRTYILLLGFVISLTQISCSSRPGGFNGYVTRSYTVRGKTYYPMSVEQGLKHKESGISSWYDESSFFGIRRGTTSLGEKVRSRHLIGAHKTLPLPSLVRVTNLANGKSVVVRINDRGPFISGRYLDLSPRAAKKLDFRSEGLARTHMEVISIGDGKYRRKARR